MGSNDLSRRHGSGPLTSQPNRRWPAFSADEPALPPVLTPVEALKSFTMAPGDHLELAAVEPLAGIRS